MGGMRNKSLLSFCLTFSVSQAWARLGVVKMPYKVSYEEDGFLRQLGLSPQDGEPLADNCSKVLV